MMKKRGPNYVDLLFLSLLFALLVLGGCIKKETPKKVSLYKKAGEISTGAELPTLNTLWFGFDVRLGPKEEVMIYTPFLKYLEKSTNKRFRIRYTGKYEDTLENLGKGITHFAAIGTLNYVLGAERYGIRYLVSGVNTDGDAEYHAAIITNSDSDIRNIRDLKGRCFAFGSEMSAQGHLIPRKMLEDAGIVISDLGKYIYTGSHINAAKSVLNGDCDAAGIQDTLAKRLDYEGKIRIIKISGPYPSSLIAYNGSLDDSIVESVRSALLSFEPTGKHEDMLFDWDKTEMPLGFTEINELELNKITALAKRYGLIKNETEN